MAPLLSLTICPIKVGKSAGTAVSIDVDGGICVLHPKTHQCLLSDPGFGQAIIDVAWTNDGYLIVTREDGSCKTWDAYSMALERETSSSQANEIQSTAELYPHDKPPARRQQLIFVQPMFLDQLDSPPILKCLSFHFDVEKMVQNIIQHYRLNQTSNKKMPSRQASEDKSQPNLTNTLKTTGMQLFSSVQSKIKESRSGRQSPATPTSPKSPQQQATSPSKLSLSSAPSLDTSESAILGPQSLAFGRILIMTLHAWGLQPSLDELLVTMISFARPKKSLIFGVRRQSCCVFFFPEEPDNFNEHWNISKDLTNLHLMSIGSLCNSLMNLSEEFLGDGRQCWSGLVTLHCALLSDLLEKYTPPALETLAIRWSDRVQEIRETGQSLLLDQLRRNDEKTRGRIIQHFLNQLSSSNMQTSNTAVVILGVLGAELNCLGQSTTRIIAQKLLSLLDANDNSISKRTAVELLGRGFHIWEPFVEPATVLLALMEMTINYEMVEPLFNKKVMVSPSAELCRASHRALCQIARSKPSVFITTIGREVARHTAAIANPATSQKFQQSTLVKAKNEVLRIIEFLAEMLPNELSLLISEVVDIVLFCLDSQAFKKTRLSDAFPPLQRFHMLSFCNNTRRIAAGTKNGQIIVYDLKTLKSQVVSAHRGAVSALCFSPDGKYLATYSNVENQLSFWVMVSSIFGMVTSHVKCVKSVGTVPLRVSSSNISENPKLVWVNKEVAVLLNSDGSEYRFTI
ncbi:Oidioi.mRNA.OKI2018_I69.PAR.g12611.t1.cds [Oikopleura dioica]|uniref:Oidioi.mRNA.OKI2018_I69.PAR.g12611.t1.cds n=1 Tax=Oikopleura dioica TaxID=34765 RepID=A0ABN7S5K1_OIKDI|nr:Oidioi.mRNA.OKI2018_I69.PAR.g12611.t1.cds [Oikopleura dioica]